MSIVFLEFSFLKILDWSRSSGFAVVLLGMLYPWSVFTYIFYYAVIMYQRKLCFINHFLLYVGDALNSFSNCRQRSCPYLLRSTANSICIWSESRSCLMIWTICWGCSMLQNLAMLEVFVILLVRYFLKIEDQFRSMGGFAVSVSASFFNFFAFCRILGYLAGTIFRLDPFWIILLRELC